MFGRDGLECIDDPSGATSAEVERRFFELCRFGKVDKVI